jgi:hypothetical protein
MGKILLMLLSVVFLTGVAPAGTLYVIDDSSNTLLSIDPVTLTITTVGPTGVDDGDFGDLAYAPGTDTLYWVPGRRNDNLYTLNRNTGAATLIGPHGITDLFTLAFDGGTLYAQSALTHGVYELNTATGAATAIGANDVYPGGYTVNTNTGELVLSKAGEGNFYSIDRGTGAATFLRSLEAGRT